MSDLVERLRYQTVLTHDQIQEVRRELKAKDDEIERMTNILEYARNEIKDGNKYIEKLEAENKDLELSRKFYREFYEETKANNERLRAERVQLRAIVQLVAPHALAKIDEAVLKGVDDE